jgi:urease accessory protein
VFANFVDVQPDDVNESGNVCESMAGSPTDKDMQRSEGRVELVLGGSERGTRVVDLAERSPIRIMFPGPRGAPVEEAVLVNTAGGIAGGDRLGYSVTALENASIAVTSQAAERVYRALSEPATIDTRLKLHEAAQIAWLPQETIVYNGARLQRNTQIEVSAAADVLALEWLVFGRAAHGEEVLEGHIIDGWQVRLDGRLIWADRFRATGDIFPRLRSRALLADFKAIGTLVRFGPDAEAMVQFMRALAPALPCHCVTTIVSGLAITRLAAAEAAELKAGLREILSNFHQIRPQGPFRVPKMWSC